MIRHVNDIHSNVSVFIIKLINILTCFNFFFSRTDDDKSAKKNFPCSYCNKRFGCRKYMRQHVLRHESQDKSKKWFCLQCDDETTR